MFKLNHTVSNDTSVPRLLILEPWATEYALAPMESLTISLESDEPGSLEMEELDEVTMLYAWAGSIAKVYKGSELMDELDRVPGIPEGTSIRTFLQLILGSKPA